MNKFSKWLDWLNREDLKSEKKLCTIILHSSGRSMIRHKKVKRGKEDDKITITVHFGSLIKSLKNFWNDKNV